MYLGRRQATGTFCLPHLTLRALWVGIALVACTFLGTALHAQNTSARQDLHDIRVAVRARQVLSQDTKLGRLNIGVSVRQGNVTLWGRAPTEALAQRAKQKIEQVQGVFSVHSELRIEPFEPERDALPTLPLAIAVPLSGPPPTGRESRSPSILAGNPRDREPVSPSLRDAAWLAQPVPTQEPPATLLSPRPVEASEGVKAAIAHVIRSDARFAKVRPEVCDGVVTLRGTVALMDHAMELARQVARLPGVESVVVDQVHLAPNP
jgi:osmotically-inducible protein OsmY